jgi:7,8-dihydropterin-6-yl-methyl-4-(beta-D-ribofuranosyl)aminobenzene 5'-phosphate synthase
MAISHDHVDHTGDWLPEGGVMAFLSRNSDVLMYLPPNVSYSSILAVQATGARTQLVNQPMEICQGVNLTGAMGGGIILEQSIVLDTPKGLVVITGCAHQGVVAAVQKAKELLGKEVYIVFGGFHLLDLTDDQVLAIIQQLKDLGVKKVGPSHCTGDRAIQLFQEAWGPDFLQVGVGNVSIPLD